MKKAIFSLLLLLTACNQYYCYDGTYVEDPYSCFNHGGLSYYLAKASHAARAGSSKSKFNASGVWDVTLVKNSGNCPGVPSSVTRTIILSQKLAALTATIPNEGRYRGRINGKIAKLSGSTSDTCAISFDTTSQFSSNTSFALKGTVTADCFGFTCSMNISGKGIKH